MIAYRLQNESLIEKEIEVDFPTRYGKFKLTAFKQTTNDVEHLALTMGSWDSNESVLVRVHSGSMVGDTFGSAQFGRGEQLHSAMETIAKEGKGVIVYINKLRQGAGLIDELKAYQQEIKNEAENSIGKMDSKDYGVGAQILRNLGVRKMKLLTNRPMKRAGIVAYGLEIVEHVPVALRETIE